MEEKTGVTSHPVLIDASRDLLFGVASAVALAGVVSYERGRPVAVPRGLRTLGAASYSLYLVHYPALSAVAMVLRRAGLTATLPPVLGASVLVAAVVAMGIAMHVAVERPLLAWLRERRRRVAGPAFFSLAA